MSSAVATYSPIFCGDATPVYQSFQSSPSLAASASGATCDASSGSSVAWFPTSVAGSMNRAVYPAAACQARVGGINNRVNRYARYVSLLQLDRRIHNRDPHAAVPVRFT